MKKILLAFQFLTIIPVKGKQEVSEKEVGSVSALFPLIGSLEGALLVGSAVLFLKVFPAELTNGLLILIIVIVNGSLHLDGLADTFDAVASRGDKEKKLAIMKESSIGTAGVIAVIMALLLKLLALNSLFQLSTSTFHFSLFLMPVFSRWTMVPAIFHAKSARQNGLGRMFIENTGLKELLIATVLTLLISLLALYTVETKSNFISYLPFLISYFIMLYAFSLIAVWFSNKSFGGMTGDTLGAVSEIAAILFLLTVLITKDYLG